MSQRQPPKDILSKMPKISPPKSNPAPRHISMPRSRSSAPQTHSLSCPPCEKRIQQRRLVEQINPSPYPLPAPPIRRVWITRGGTSFSPNHIKRRANASKSAGLLNPAFLFFLFLTPVGRFVGLAENDKTIDFTKAHKTLCGKLKTVMLAILF